jgi:GTPase SAR1 family protein
MSDSVPTARVLVLGDSGAGKTSLIHALARPGEEANVGWTVGCHTDVLFFDSRMSGQCSIEFLEVGGSSSKLSRSVFYENFQGILLVYDVTNVRSFRNLSGWLDEVAIAQKVGSVERLKAGLPILLVGMKSDKIESRSTKGGRRHKLSIPGVRDHVEVSTARVAPHEVFHTFFHRLTAGASVTRV